MTKLTKIVVTTLALASILAFANIAMMLISGSPSVYLGMAANGFIIVGVGIVFYMAAIKRRMNLFDVGAWYLGPLMVACLFSLLDSEWIGLSEVYRQIFHDLGTVSFALANAILVLKADRAHSTGSAITA